MALSGHYRGKLYHREIDLVKALPHHASERHMDELVGFLLVEGVNVGSSGPASPSRTIGGVVSPVRSSIPTPSGLPAGVQAEKGNAPIQKRRSLCVVPSSYEETESDDAGLRPRKVRRTVLVAKLLGCIGGILGSEFSVPEKKEGVVVPSSSMTRPSSFTGSISVDPDSVFVLEGALGSPRGHFQPGKPSLVGDTRISSHHLSSEAYAPDWAIGRDSLLSEDIAAQEWSRSHPSATMNSLASQSSSRMAGDLRYVAAQTFAIMVVAADRVCRASVNEKQLKTFQGVMASIREELHDSEAERQPLSEQNFIVACDKAALEDHMTTLDDRLERLESQGSSLTWEKGVLVSDLSMCQRQLARARFDGVVARGGLQWMLEKGVVRVIDKVIESA
ncbi:hypothetical protein Lser_V15G39308 [Lactuca serriola]